MFVLFLVSPPNVNMMDHSLGTFLLWPSYKYSKPVYIMDTCDEFSPKGGGSTMPVIYTGNALSQSKTPAKFRYIS